MSRVFLFLLSILLLTHSTHAAEKVQAALVVDVRKLKVLHDRNAHHKLYPASLTKMMTLYLVFDALKARKITMDTQIKISKAAASQRPSKLGLRPGETITVKAAIDALIVKSANDIAYALAEYLGHGNIDTFVKKMNSKAIRIGMKRTNFVNPTGWHHPKQHTTAYDMAKLAISLRIYHQEYYKLFSTKEFNFRGRKIRTTNKVMLKCNYVDGIKTGFTNAAGFNLVTSAKNRNANIVAVVMGGRSAVERDQAMLSLIKKFVKA